MAKKTTDPVKESDNSAKKTTKADIVQQQKKEHRVGKKIRTMAAQGGKGQFNRMLAMTQPKQEKPAAE
jgi:hypothetical protein